MKALRPYFFDHLSDFKYHAWQGAVRAGFEPVGGAFPRWPLRRLAYAHDLVPTLWQGEPRLCFAEPVSITFDTFPVVATHEVVPFLWDCWSHTLPRLCRWLKRHRVRRAVVTSAVAADNLRVQLPQLDVLTVTEGVLPELFPAGLPLAERDIDVYHYGGRASLLHTTPGLWREQRYGTNEEFHDRLKRARLTFVAPKHDIEPRYATHDTLTQRYWECMFSRIVMLGRAPQELIDLIGYNPVLPCRPEEFQTKALHVLAHIADYQPLVDRNRVTARHYGDWAYTMNRVKQWLSPT